MGCMVQFMVCCESLLAHSISRLIIWKKCSQPYTEGVSYGALNAPYNFFSITKHMTPNICQSSALTSSPEIATRMLRKSG
jgi:hypothetical protein